MIRTEIYIENQRLDITKEISAEFTYNIDDIKDFSSRNTNFSKTIILPGNANNNKLFGHIFEFTNANFYNPTNSNVGYNYNAAKSAQCVIYVDKIQVFKGVLRLLEIIVDNGSIEYECAVFGELGGFVSALGIAKLEDLDFSQYDEDWTWSNIVTSWDEASGTTGAGSGLYYPLIDYGKVSFNNKKNWSYKAFRPALYVREYIDKIITGAGYTWESDFFNSALFKRLVIPNNQKQLSKYSDILSNYYFEIDQTTYQGSPTAIPLITIDTINIQGPFTASNSNTRFTYTGTTQVTGTYNLTIGGSTDLVSEPLYFEVLKNGTVVSSLELQPGPFYISGSVLPPITLSTNDYVEFRFNWQSWVDGIDIQITIDSATLILNATATQLVPVAFEETININSTIPRGIFQKDFFASIVKMFNLYVVEDANIEKKLIIEPYIDFYATNPTFLQVNDLEENLLIDNNDFLLLDDANIENLDWTNKVDRNKPFRIRPMSELNGRYYEFKYKTDVDYYNEQYSKKYAQGYGDFIEDTGWEFANDKQTAEVIFSSTPLVGYNGEDKIFPTIFKISNQSGNQSEDPTEHNIRIMQIRKIDGVSGWHIRNDSGNEGSELYVYGYAGHLDDPDAPLADINFGAAKEIYFELATGYPSANLFNGFWSDYIAEITSKDSKLLTCNILLKDSDIYSLDFSKLIYLEGALWRLNKVIDYNPMSYDTTKVELLKVIELTY
jgi:hypothetical protein